MSWKNEKKKKQTKTTAAVATQFSKLAIIN